MFKHWGCTRSCQVPHPGQLIPVDKGVIPYHTALCPVLKTQEEKEEEGTCELHHLSSQVTAPAFLEMAKDLPVDGKQ